MNFLRPVGGSSNSLSSKRFSGGLSFTIDSLRVVTVIREAFAELIPSFLRRSSLNHFFSHFIRYSSMQSSTLPELASIRASSCSNALEAFPSASVKLALTFIKQKSVFSPTTDAKLRREEHTEFLTLPATKTLGGVRANVGVLISGVRSPSSSGVLTPSCSMI